MAFYSLQFNKGNLQRLITSITGIVNSWSGGSTGLTPNTPSSGDVVLGGTLNVANGGTGSTTSTGTAASGVVLRTSPIIDTSLTVSGAVDTTALKVLGRLNNSAVVVNVVDFNITATSFNTSSQAVRVTGGAAASTVLGQLDTSGNLELAGYASIGRALSLTAGGSVTLATYFGSTANGRLGVFGGIGSPTFNPLGRAGGIYLNATTTVGAPGIPSYNTDGTATGWQTLVGREATQTLTNKTLAAPTITGVMSGVGSQSATTFLAGDVALNNASNFFDGPNTGSIGAAGQIWQITAVGQTAATAGAATTEVAIFNGAAYIANSVATSQGASAPMVTTIMAIVTLSAATTFTLRAKSNQTTCSLQTTGGATGISNKATSITAVRLA